MPTSDEGRSARAITLNHNQKLYVANAARVLEACRKSGDRVRRILGNTGTGESWLDEHDVVGTIRRSGGMLKVPLLIADRLRRVRRCGNPDCAPAGSHPVERWPVVVPPL